MKGLKTYHDEKGIPGRQYPTDIGTIDLLCIDNNKKFVVIEIKKETGSDKTVGQITRYMGWIKKNLANNKEVRGIIIVHEIDERLEYSSSATPVVKQCLCPNANTSAETAKQAVLKINSK